MLSVIIPTRNRGDLLALALDSLTQQTLSFDKYEVLVIDNGSSDKTAQIARNVCHRLCNLRYFYEAAPGLHAGRHRGLLEAQGEILIFADDDIEAFPTWLSSISDAFSTPDVAMVGGNNLPMFMAPPPDWLQSLWSRAWFTKVRALPVLSILELTGPSREFSPEMVWGCNFAIRKNILQEAGGFHPDGMPAEMIRFRGDGETHVSRYVAKSGAKCIFHPGATVYHKVSPERMTFQYFRQRGFSQGISDSYTTLRNQNANTGEPSHISFGQPIRKFWSALKGIALVDQEAKRALREFAEGQSEGYAYHQRIYLEDPEVRKWVHKPTYFAERST